MSREGEAPAEPGPCVGLGGSLALPYQTHAPRGRGTRLALPNLGAAG